MSLDEVAAEDVVTADRDTPIRTIVAKMAERDVGSVVVVDGGEPVGIITDRKVALALEEAPDVAQRSAEELIGDDLVTVDQSMTIFEVLQTMSDHGIRRLPIVDEENRLQGIVSLDDVLVLLGTEIGNVADTIESQLSRL
jgi:CBS domain-containing protein